jgi:hypothetical protein
MADNSETLQNEFNQQRKALGRNVQELQYRMRSMISWRDQYKQHPWTGAGLAFAGGVLISTLASRRHSPNGNGYSMAATEPRGQRRMSKVFDGIAAALTSVAASYAKEFLSAAIPRFRDEFERRSKREPWPDR